MTPIDPLILALIMLASRVFDVPAPLIAAIIDVESGFNFHAVGDHDEEGVPQSYGLMMLHVKGAGVGYPTDLLLNPAFNVFVGTDYLKTCLDAHPNFPKLAISSYKQGPWGAAQRGYEATRSYVDNVLNLKKKYTEEFREGKDRDTN